jgi:hypothetical protein
VASGSHDSGLGKRKESLHIKTSNGNWKSLKMLSLEILKVQAEKMFQEKLSW